MITQPQENPNIPEHLARQVSGVRDQITLGQGEVARLQGLVASLQYEVNQLVIQKHDVEKVLASLRDEEKRSQDAVTAYSSQVETLKVSLASAAAGVEETNKQRRIAEETTTTEMIQIFKEKEALVESKRKHAQDVSDLAAERSNHTERVEKLRKAIS